MKVSRYVHSLIKDESIIIKIEKKSEIGFWEYQFIGFLAFFFSRNKDFLFITNRRLIYMIKNKLIKNIEYSDFSTFEFNSISEIIHLKDTENKTHRLNLKKLRLSFEEIQYLKKKINE